MKSPAMRGFFLLHRLRKKNEANANIMKSIARDVSKLLLYLLCKTRAT